MNKFVCAALGGTFDHFHKGHETLLKHAFGLASRIIVGITADTFVLEKQLSHLIEPYETRVRSVIGYASSLDRADKLSIVKLEDLYGPTLKENDIDCLVVSPLTKSGGDLINSKRKLAGLNKLPIEVCSIELSTDDEPISSTRIRKGEINRKGFVYSRLFTKDIILTPKQKEAVKKPYGQIVYDVSNLKNTLYDHFLVTTVGDRATKVCLENGVHVHIGVYDNHEQRKPIGKPLSEIINSSNIIKVNNPPGAISQKLYDSLKQAIQVSKFIEVQGEEDLAVIPLALTLPLGSAILYGQPNEGLVMVEVTEEKKEWVKELLEENL